ncbi:MAG: SAM-dependent chlorinase/fluorinase [Chloroflexota bacterium]|nr:MAG: hypothetical protein DIU68_10585 [Chloroflexota bacterium]
MQPVIALLTDFGLADGYVGVMKGVMLGIHSQTRFIDVTHAIEPQNVRQAAFTLLTTYRYFPHGTIFLVVVDPGVGSERRPLVASAGGYLFVAPDNGVLSYVLDEWDEATFIEPTEERFHLPEVSSTFHGRDIFAPLAANLAANVPLHALGFVITDPVRLPAPLLETSGERIIGEVLHIDHFGNVVTSIGTCRWAEGGGIALTPRFNRQPRAVTFDAATAEVQVAGQSLVGVRRTYAEAESGELVAIIGSSGFLEIAVNRGSAASRLGVNAGDRIEVRLQAWAEAPF